MIPDFELPKLAMKDISGFRHYVTPEGNYYPSVTTVLKTEPGKQEKLEEWREREIAKGNDPDKYTKQSASRGTEMHKLCERYIDNEEDIFRGAMPDAIAMFKSIQPYINETSEVWCQEQQLYSDFLRTAGRVDLIGKWRGIPSIIDFKQSNKYKKKSWISGYFMQCAAYAVMFEELTKISIPQIVVIMAVKDANPLIFVEQRDKYIWEYIELRNNYDEVAH